MRLSDYFPNHQSQLYIQAKDWQEAIDFFDGIIAG